MIRLLLTLSSVFLLILPAGAQGPLAPPAGPPAAGMKSLQELWDKVNSQPVDKRTPISGSVELVTPGSYYLTQNITSASGTAITISGVGITLDLNGFTIDGRNNANGRGIVLVSSARSTRIMNGNILGGVTRSGSVFSAGTFVGISGSNGASGLTIERLCISGARHGIDVKVVVGSVVKDCAVSLCSSHGIRAGTVTGSSAFLCETTGIEGDTVSGCTAESLGAGSSGVPAGIRGGQVTNCTAKNIGTSGMAISADNVTDCVAVHSGTGIGIYADVVSNSKSTATSGTAISGTSITNCVATSTNGSPAIAADNGTVANCRGSTYAGGIAISALVATGCVVPSGQSINATVKENCVP
ncbi:hypothetical protein OKA04_04870 [Luteolibacter flavescens]|uniref:Right handed beta helix domain-containing protein n=1 Tax=Luteolibacter flavescens TaxID=1859460 RepID=A0ABT3FM54_9BACT|nr:hypothetical protein [Luteolibacter flavescens]MCW1884050.1 hypothetical protein [Luteolibacter flavescens]